MSAWSGIRPGSAVRGDGRWPADETAGESDAGVATVLVAAGLAALLVVLIAATWLAAAVTARHRAGAAADLTALAGAAVVVRGADAVCAAAVRVAEANGAALDSCRVTGVTVRVATTVAVRVGPIDGSAVGRAQAGPVSDVGVPAVGGSGDDAVPDAP